MKEIYIVTCGEYSDYRIVDVFEDNELAEAVAWKVGGEVETHQINHSITINKLENFDLYSVYMDKHGNTSSIEKDNDDFNFNKLVGNNLKPYYNFLNESRWIRYNITVEPKMCVVCWAKDEKHAVKIANEIRIQILANNSWGKEE